MSDELRAADLEAVRRQLRRDPTTPFSVVARCSGGHPLVIRNRPVDADGHPFPTMYWLTCVDAVKAVSRVESQGWVARLAEDPAIAEGVEAAHRSYAAERGDMLSGAEAWGGVGGTRRGIKCLHAHYAYHLAGGDDVVGRWTAAHVEPIHAAEPGGRVAAIDQGTNSTRLLVLEPREEDEPSEIARDMVITRLGKGVDETGRLDPVAIDRAVEAIARFSLRAQALHVERIRVGATSAVRDAENREEFLARVRDATGIEPDVIDGQREAALSFLGGTRGLAPDLGPFLLIDIGGGSTEFVIGREPAVAERAISTQLGSVRLTEQVAPSDPPSDDDLRAFEALIAPRLDEAQRAIPVGEAQGARRRRGHGDHPPGVLARPRAIRPGADPPIRAHARGRRADLVRACRSCRTKSEPRSR